jgi:hydroxysqualene synthase
VTHWPVPLARAYAACDALARSHYENFPVASWLLPRPMRPHVAAVYAYARAADDMADEGTASAADRLARLDAWRRRLHDAVDGAVDGAADDPSGRVVDPGRGAADGNEDLIIIALAHSIRSLDLPIALFDDLLSAFGQDTMTTRYASWADVFEYCRRSANPVGRLVLRIAGVRDERLERSSDAMCTALQLTNFWQDLGRDWRNGRLYVPHDLQLACGAIEADLAAGETQPLNPAWRQALAQCVAITREQFVVGRAVCDGVTGRLRYELRMTWLGGTRILERVDATRSHLMTRRPALGGADVPLLAWRAARWPSAA